MSNLRELAYRVDPALWVRGVVGVEPTKWQEEFLRAPRGASILALTARQCGKTTTAAWAMAHAARNRDLGSLNSESKQGASGLSVAPNGVCKPFCHGGKNGRVKR